MTTIQQKEQHAPSTRSLLDAFTARGDRRATDDVTRLGTYRHKYHMRAVFQSLAFLSLIACALLYTAYTRRFSTDSSLEEDEQLHRSLIEDCDDMEKVDPEFHLVFYIVGVLYMFLALAIVCDEFFVPALEEMSSNRRLNLSMDVAGATLMAAGGSAPELFSSLFGTFQESEIGFGTIIGSAVFNVLFVIAMCSIFSKDVLALTWWPLFRDSLCYAIGLIVLAVFVGVTTPEKIVFWEGAVLFGMYILYILIMWKNADIYKYLTGKELEYPEDVEDDEDYDNPTITVSGSQRPEEKVDPERPVVTRQHSHSSINSASNLGNLQAAVAASANKQTSYFNWQGTFRAGILKLMRDPTTWVETGGVGIVAKIAGDADFVFRQIDENQDGHLDKYEVKKLFDALECRMTDAEFDEVFNQLDADHDGVIDEEEFHKWYTSSVELIRSQVRAVFDELDKDKSGTLDKYEIKALLLELDPRATDEDVKEAVEAMYKHGSREEVTFEEFEEWYEHSIIYERQKKRVEEDMEGVWESLKPPFGESFFSWLQYLLVFPLVLAMALTIPDVRRPGWAKFCYLSFFLSIAWIGGFAYLMVNWAELIGNTIGVPSVVMGLTVLAAGTSVPDLLSSVIVARRGSGDMAVSSSIGSNIFDILVGLPVPWMLYTAYWEKPDEVLIGSDNIFISLSVLLAMLVFLVLTVHCQGWKLTKTLGAMMMVFYVGFLVQAIALELPFETCIES